MEPPLFLSHKKATMLKVKQRKASCSGLTQTSKKHKALAHDMHVESNALRQRFVPQPMLRSSWPQLVIPVLGTGICKEDARVKPEHD